DYYCYSADSSAKQFFF
nr:immunoglobulin light chain junction region [Macaca mulatta]